MKQLKQVELVTLLEPLLGNSPKQEQNYTNCFTCFQNGHKKVEMYWTT
jgi:hypothetical protein